MLPTQMIFLMFFFFFFTGFLKGCETPVRGTNGDPVSLVLCWQPIVSPGLNFRLSLYASLEDEVNDADYKQNWFVPRGNYKIIEKTLSFHSTKRREILIWHIKLKENIFKSRIKYRRRKGRVTGTKLYSKRNFLKIFVEAPLQFNTLVYRSWS